MTNTIPVVGIDLGTTNSAVAYISGGKPEIIPSPNGERIIPSVVMLDMENKVLVGSLARASLVAMPDRTVAAIKRKMGSKQPVTMSGQEYLPQEISAMIIKELKAYVDAKFGDGEKEAVITVPAYFTDEQRRATKQAGELAGFIVDRIINEPTAAALAFGLEKLDADQHILVYDLGGGTFDVSIVEMMDGILEVKASAGNNLLGGEDFDWRLVDFLAEKIINEHHIDPRKDIRAKSLLKEQAEKIKIQLSQTEKAAVQLPLVTIKDNKPVGLSTSITRQQFINLIEDLLTETMRCVKQTLDDARLAPGDIQDILLVGGSTRIPRVREMISDYFGKPPRHDINPDEAVALGAAVQAGLKAGLLADSGLIVTDVSPFSLGISVLGQRFGNLRSDLFHAIIPRNTTIPVSRTDRFYTSVPGQTVAEIKIFQGEHDLTKYNHLLGTFMLEGIPRNWSKCEAVDVTYTYNLNGILEVTAQCVANKKQAHLTVNDALDRENTEALTASMEKIEALYNNAPAIGEEPDEDFDDFSDEQDSFELDDSPAALKQQATELQAKIATINNKLNSVQQKKLKKLTNRLEQAMQSDNTEKLMEIMDQITDFLIDIELEEE